MTFEGFSSEGLRLLSDLSENDKTWFDTHRKDYDRELASPAKAFVSDLGAVLQETISPQIQAIPKTNGSIAPINNDLRFTPDASPYKDHLMFRFWEGEAKKTAPTLMVHTSPKRVGFATGMMFADLDRWRAVIDDEASGAEGAAAIEKLASDTGADVVGEGYKRVPKPYPPDHERADLLRHKGLQVRWIVPAPNEIHSSDFIDWCASELARAGEVHRWLVRTMS